MPFDFDGDRDGWGRPRTIRGVNPIHPCAAQLRLAAYCVGGTTVIDAVTGQIGAPSGLVNASKLPFLGPGITNSWVTFANRPATNNGAITLAGIAYVPAASSFVDIGSTTYSTGGGWGIRITGGGVLTVSRGGTSISGGPTLPKPDVYFVWASINVATGILNMAAKSLSTNKIYTAVITGQTTAPTAPSGTYAMGYILSAPNVPGTTGMFCFSAQSYPLVVGIAWAQDPWGIFVPGDFSMLPVLGYAPSSVVNVSVSLGISANDNVSAATVAAAVASTGVSSGASTSVSGTAVASASLGTTAAAITSAAATASVAATLGTTEAIAGAMTATAAVSASLGAAPGQQSSAVATLLSSVALGAQAALAGTLAALLRASSAIGTLFGIGSGGVIPVPLTVNPRYIAASPLAPFIAATQPFFVAPSPKPNWTASMQSTRDLSPPLAAGGSDSQIATFDFGPRLPAGVTVATVTSVTATVHTGSDLSPQSIVNGSASIGTAPAPNGSGVTNGAVLQRIGGNASGVGGTNYLLVCKTVGSDGFPYSEETHVSFYTPS